MNSSANIQGQQNRKPATSCVRAVAAKLDVAHSTFARVVSGRSSVTPDMAIRLSKVLGGSPESWLQMQVNHDLWVARQQEPHDELVAFEFA
ncbi:HigA family addiction module antitoxin [Acaryochloris thomasi]|uniref:HigA family addiction module antitoxin n=1 Tax=Acaryochloris thomasi TaxID=2929456 RepID=UPI000DA6424E|nr:HigA family addiction module antitoxin [Acaryochloris thomasi]